MKRSLLLTLLACLSAVPLGAQTPVPSYIRADPAAARTAFGSDVAAKIFSDAYTPIRRDMVIKSAKRLPAYECPDNVLMALAWVTPFPVKSGAVSWIERFIVDCKPRTQRNFLSILEGEAPRMIELLPGGSMADPVLQRDAFTGSSAAVVGARPQGCDKQWIVDTRLLAPRKDNEPWTERWSYDLCGNKADVDMTFTPSARSGTTWNAKLVK